MDCQALIVASNSGRTVLGPGLLICHLLSEHGAGREVAVWPECRQGRDVPVVTLIFTFLRPT